MGQGAHECRGVRPLSLPGQCDIIQPKDGCKAVSYAEHVVFSGSTDTSRTPRELQCHTTCRYPC